MKRLISVFVLAAFTMVSTPTIASANVATGQKVFKKKLRKYCGFSGVRFARTHSQDEWEEIYDNGDFEKETKKICPRLDVKSIKKSWWKDLYEFVYEYGTGGSHVPKC